MTGTGMLALGFAALITALTALRGYGPPGDSCAVQPYCDG
jgi:hypothetical protein